MKLIKSDKSYLWNFYVFPLVYFAAVTCYPTGNPDLETQPEIRDEKRFPNGTVVGKYTYMDNEGNPIQVKYYADDANYGVELKSIKVVDSTGQPISADSQTTFDIQSALSPEYNLNGLSAQREQNLHRKNNPQRPLNAQHLQNTQRIQNSQRLQNTQHGKGFHRLQSQSHGQQVKTAQTAHHPETVHHTQTVQNVPKTQNTKNTQTDQTAQNDPTAQSDQTDQIEQTAQNDLSAQNSQNVQLNTQNNQKIQTSPNSQSTPELPDTQNFLNVPPKYEFSVIKTSDTEIKMPDILSNNFPSMNYKYKNDPYDFLNKELSKINRYKIEKPNPDYEIYYQNELKGPKQCGKEKVRIYFDKENRKIRSAMNNFDEADKFCEQF